MKNLGKIEKLNIKSAIDSSKLSEMLNHGSMKPFLDYLSRSGFKSRGKPLNGTEYFYLDPNKSENIVITVIESSNKFFFKLEAEKDLKEKNIGRGTFIYSKEFDSSYNEGPKIFASLIKQAVNFKNEVFSALSTSIERF